jgi:pimeloyl-ACP methyl ester carboxylesterase
MTTLLIPGFMLDYTLWDDLLPLVPAAQPVQFAALAGGDTVEAMAAAVLAEAPPTFTLVGFSMGGYVAREMARMAPERVTALALWLGGGTAALGCLFSALRRRAPAMD